VAEEVGGSGTGDMDCAGYVTNGVSPFEVSTHGSPKGALLRAGVLGIEESPEGTSGVLVSRSFCDSPP
jgi:hypothetical protein